MASTRNLELPAAGARAEITQGSIYFVGTATVVLRFAGFTILTDPNFLHRGDHVHLGYGLRSRRRSEPAIAFHELPPLDLVLLSHLHEDHFDRIAERRLDRDLLIVTNTKAAGTLRGKGFRRVEGLQSWEPLTLTRGEVALRITAMPGRHGHASVSKLLPPVMGSMLEFETGGRILQRMYITGDTLVYDQLREIPMRYPEIDVALLHLGGTRIAGVLLTMDAREGVEALQIIAPRTAIPIHYDDYTVFKSPLEEFVQAVKAAGLEERVHYLARGETYTFSARRDAAQGSRS